MIQAASSGAINFNEANLLDRYWWIKARWLLNQIEDENVLTMMRMQHAQHVAVLDYKNTEQAFNLHWDGSNALIKNTFNALFPWTVAQEKDPSEIKGKYAAILEEWKKRFGDIKDPAVKARYAKKAKQIMDGLEKKKIKAAEDAETKKKLKAQKQLEREERRKNKKNKFGRK